MSIFASWRNLSNSCLFHQNSLHKGDAQKLKMNGKAFLTCYHTKLLTLFLAGKVFQKNHVLEKHFPKCYFSRISTRQKSNLLAMRFSKKILFQKLHLSESTSTVSEITFPQTYFFQNLH